jgi:hypothetical protein
MGAHGIFELAQCQDQLRAGGSQLIARDNFMLALRGFGSHLAFWMPDDRFNDGVAIYDNEIRRDRENRRATQRQYEPRRYAHVAQGGDFSETG